MTSFCAGSGPRCLCGSIQQCTQKHELDSGRDKRMEQKEENSEGKQQVGCPEKFYSESRMGGENEFGEATDDHFREHRKCKR